MQRKTVVTAAALATGLAFGSVAGPSLIQSRASAQTQQPTQTPAPTQSPAAAPSNSLSSLFLDKLAAALNIPRATLNSAITSAGNSTADAAVQQGTLTQAQADALKARVQAGDPGAFFGGRHGGKGGPAGFADGGVRQAMFDAAAKALNLTSDELTTQLRSGQTLAQLAQAHNTTEQVVTNAALAAAKTQLDQQVASGALTQQQADTIYARLQQEGAQFLAPRGRGGKGDHDRSGTPATPAAPSASPSSSNS